MGGGVSADLPLEQILSEYHANPERWEDLITKCREHHVANIEAKLQQQQLGSSKMSIKSDAHHEVITSELQYSAVPFTQYIVHEINLLRKNPAVYSVYMEKYLHSFIDDHIYVAEDGTKYRSKEGKQCTACALISIFISI